AAGVGISLDKVLTDFGKLLGGERKILLDYLARDGQTNAEQKINILLEKLSDGWYVLLLDNLETLQDSNTYALTDPDIHALLEAAIQQSGHLTVLLTSREPVSLSRTSKTWERQVLLDEGLKTEDAIALLRRFDADGVAGLRDASDEQLRA